MLRAFKIPIGWRALLTRTGTEIVADNCMQLAAALAYNFFLALFPALLFLVAIVSYIPIHDLMNTITAALARVAPGAVISIVQDQLLRIAHQNNGGLLTIGFIGTLWSSSSGITSLIDTLNQAYDIQEERTWWRVRLIAIGLTVAIGIFLVISFALVMIGPTLAEKVAAWFYLGPAFTWTWKILQWPVVFALFATGVAVVYYYGPDAVQEWVWLTPGSTLATLLWLLISLGFKVYVAHFSSYNATYGTIGGVIVLMLWFYVSALAFLAGAELNAEIEHASPYGKDPGEKVAGEKKKIGRAAERAWAERKRAGELQPAFEGPNCDVDNDLPAVPVGIGRPQPRVSDWILSGLVLGETALLLYAKLKRRLRGRVSFPSE